MIEAASVCTRSGKVLLSRQFVELSSERVHEILAAVPRLVLAGAQHTTVEENGVRYLWEPLDDLHVVVVTDLSSNILQDIKTMRLLAQTIKLTAAGGSTNVLDERHVIDNTFAIIDAFDEVITAGYAESLTLSQVETFLEMESHEEKIQEIIEHNKQLEAAEERKKKARELEQQRKQARKVTPTGIGSGMGRDSYAPAASSFGSASSGGLPNPNAPTAAGSFGGSLDLDAGNERTTRGTLGSHASGPKGKGLKLGKSRSGGIASTPLLADPEPVPVREMAAHSIRDSSPAVKGSGQTEIALSEGLAIELSRDGQVRSSRAAGTLNLYAGDRSKAKLRVQTKTDGPASAYKPHPKMDRSLFATEGVVSLRDSDQEFPPSNVLLVKWSVEGIEVPITVSCWVSESTDPGFVNITLEYEVSSSFEGVLEDVTIKVPLLSSNAHVLDPTAVYEQFDDHMLWTLPSVSATKNPSGSFEFTAEADSEDEFYPLHVSFSAKCEKPFGHIDVTEVTDVTSGESMEYVKTIEAHTTSFVVR